MNNRDASTTAALLLPAALLLLGLGGSSCRNEPLDPLSAVAAARMASPDKPPPVPGRDQLRPSLARAPVAAPAAAREEPAPAAAPVTSAADQSPPGELRWLRLPGRPLSIAATEVTVAHFRACLEAGACRRDTFRECNFGAADKDEHPMNCVSFYGAEQFCAYAGGRVCTEPEWLEACAGPERRPFPYGQQFDFAACNSQSQTMAVPDRKAGTVPVGSLAGCEGGLEGLFDMAGNVAEWVDSCKGTYCKFRGAGFRSNDPVDRFAACKGVCSGNQKQFLSPIIGIRCCRDEP